MAAQSGRSEGLFSGVVPARDSACPPLRWKIALPESAPARPSRPRREREQKLSVPIAAAVAPALASSKALTDWSPPLQRFRASRPFLYNPTSPGCPQLETNNCIFRGIVEVPEDGDEATTCGLETGIAPEVGLLDLLHAKWRRHRSELPVEKLADTGNRDRCHECTCTDCNSQPDARPPRDSGSLRVKSCP
jgi:hypothetical protein